MTSYTTIGSMISNERYCKGGYFGGIILQCKDDADVSQGKDQAPGGDDVGKNGMGGNSVASTSNSAGVGITQSQSMGTKKKRRYPFAKMINDIKVNMGADSSLTPPPCSDSKATQDDLHDMPLWRVCKVRKRHKDAVITPETTGQFLGGNNVNYSDACKYALVRTPVPIYSIGGTKPVTIDEGVMIDNDMGDIEDDDIDALAKAHCTGCGVDAESDTDQAVIKKGALVVMMKAYSWNQIQFAKI